MNNFNVVGMNETSADELEMIEGGFGPLIFLAGGLVGIGSVALGNEIGKALNGGNLGSGLAGIAKAAGLKQ